MIGCVWAHTVPAGIFPWLECNMLVSPPPSEHISQQLCAPHWLVEALALKSNSLTHSILTWNPRGRSEVLEIFSPLYVVVSLLSRKNDHFSGMLLIQCHAPWTNPGLTLSLCSQQGVVQPDQQHSILLSYCSLPGENTDIPAKSVFSSLFLFWLINM